MRTTMEGALNQSNRSLLKGQGDLPVGGDEAKDANDYKPAQEVNGKGTSSNAQ